MRKSQKHLTATKPHFSLGTPLSKKILPLFYLIITFLIFLGNLAVNLFKLLLKIILLLNLFRLFQYKTKSRSHKRSFQKSFLYKHKLEFALFLIFIVLFIYYSAILIEFASRLPTPTRLSTTPKPLTTQIYDRNGNLLYQFYSTQNRELITLDKLPKYTTQATIAMEDKHFYTHPGIDITGILRALKANLFDGQKEGGSTITQQLVKSTLLSPDQTLKRKIEEALLALWTETIYSKNDILQMYFNEVSYGGPTRGIAAASQMYFGKEAEKLDLAESAFLAGLTAAPSEYSPYGPDPEKGKLRQTEVLNRMVKDGYITKDQEQQALLETLSLKPPTTDIKAPHFVMYIKSLLEDRYGQNVVTSGGLKVITSLDLNIQNMVQDILYQKVGTITYSPTANGASMVLDARTGQILAMVGSKNYFDPNGGNFNAALALRPPGSSIKVVTYATAFKIGYSPGNIILDAPITFTNPWGESYTPHNYDNSFHGLVSIRTALGSSYNIPAVKMLNIVGISNMIQTGKDMGITTWNNPSDYGLSLTLGGGPVKMIDMMSVYDTLATGGVRLTPQAILKVTDSYGNVLEDNQNPEGKRVLTEDVVYMLSDILSDNKARTPVFGPNSALVIPGHTVAVKTGTSDDKKDNWTLGYTPEYVVGVWVGHNDNTPLPTAGSEGAGPIWHAIMTQLLQDRPNISFEKPKGVIDALVDGHLDIKVAGVASKSLISFIKPKEDKDKKPWSITFRE